LAIRAAQAANEIAARQVISLMRLQELNATYQRAVMAREAERQAKETAARERLRRQVESLGILKGM